MKLNRKWNFSFHRHMLFKGTETKTAKDIAMTIENVGGQINAFTGKECTFLHRLWMRIWKPLWN